MKRRYWFPLLSCWFFCVLASPLSAQVITISKSVSPAVAVPGDTVTVCLTINSATLQPKADIVWVVDTTSSMSSKIAGIEANISSFTSQLVASNIDYRQGLQEFGDVNYSNCVSLTSHGFAANDAQFLSWVSAMTVCDGGDMNESDLEGLQAAGAFPWRTDASHVMILVTDAPMHSLEGDAKSPLSYPGMIANMKGLGVVVDAIGPYSQIFSNEDTTTFPNEDPKTFALATGGLWLDSDTSSDWSSFLTTLGASVAKLSGVTIRDPLPVQLAPIPGNSGGASIDGNQLVWSVTSIQRGSPYQVCAPVKLVQPIPGTLLNTGYVSADGVSEVGSIPATMYQPTPTSTPTITFTPTITPTSTFTPTPTITNTPTATATSTPDFALWPNPYNPRTAVRGTLKAGYLEGGTLEIYTVSGENVVKLIPVNGWIEWDGKTKDNKTASPGIYYYLARRNQVVVQKGTLLLKND